MAVIGTNGLDFWVGDGAVEERFLPLVGGELKRLEITQQLVDSPAVRADIWSVGGALKDRRAVLECTALATDSTAADRIRALAIADISGNFRLRIRPTQTVIFAAYVVSYRETLQAGGITQLQFRLESTGAMASV